MKKAKYHNKVTFQTDKVWRLIIGALLVIIWISPYVFAQDKIVAIVNTDVVTQKDLDDFVNFLRVQLAAEYRGEQLEARIQSMKSDLLDRLIEDRLILQEAKKNKIKIDENKVKGKIDEIKKRYESDNDFRNALMQQGLTQADIEARIREQLLMYTVIDTKIKSKILVSPGEVTEFYDKNINQFKIPTQREFDSIAIDNENLARDIFNSLRQGQDLQDLTKKYSLEVNKFSARHGGELKKEIEDTVFKLNIGEVSKPIKIDDRYYIFRLNKIIPPRQQSLSETQDRIYAFLFEKKMQEELTRWIDGLKKHSYIQFPQLQPQPQPQN